MLTYDPKVDTLKQCALDAGYAPETAENQTARLTEAVGFRRAQEAIAAKQLDSARGIMGLSRRALERGAAKLDELEAREQLAIGLKAAEIAANLGENLEVSGDADRWKQRLRRACRLMARLTESRLRKPQDVALSPEVIETG
jgi:hypothetical protein